MWVLRAMTLIRKYFIWTLKKGLSLITGRDVGKFIRIIFSGNWQLAARLPCLLVHHDIVLHHFQHFHHFADCSFCWPISCNMPTDLLPKSYRNYLREPSASWYFAGLLAFALVLFQLFAGAAKSFMSNASCWTFLSLITYSCAHLCHGSDQTR